MSRDLLNQMRREASSQALERARTRLGTITGYDATNFLAKVVLQPDGVETGWLPIGTIGVGSGCGVLVAPEIGQVVQVEFQDGGVDAGLITMRFHNDATRPPGPVAPGEIWLVHKAGAFLKFNADGTISSSGAWTHTGQITASTDVIGGGKSLKNHTHGGVTVGGGSTGAPN